MCRMYSPVVNFNAPLNTQFGRIIPLYPSLPSVGPYWLRFGAQTSQSALGKKNLVVGDNIYIYVYMICVHQIGYTVYVHNSVYVHATAKWCGLSTSKPCKYVYILIFTNWEKLQRIKFYGGWRAIFRVCFGKRNLQYPNIQLVWPWQLFE